MSRTLYSLNCSKLQVNLLSTLLLFSTTPIPSKIGKNRGWPGTKYYRNDLCDMKSGSNDE